MPNRSIQIAPSSETGLAATLNSLQESIYAAAERNLRASLVGSPANYTPTTLERAAIIEIEALKLTNGIDLAALLIRGRILKKIREQNLMNVHPEHYTTLAEMASAQGISSAEMSNTDTLCNVIFPYLEENGISVAEMWHEVGKAKFFELVPVLSAVITGQLPGRGATREAVLAVLNDQGGEVSGDGNSVSVSDAVRGNAVSRLLQIGSTLPVREMRRQLRPEGTADIPMVIVRDGDMYYGVMAMDEDQRTMFHRINGTHINETTVSSSPEIQPQVDLIRRMIGAS